MARSNLRNEGGRVLSYNTCIKDVLPGGYTIGNVTPYSVTTSRHQHRSFCWSCDVVVANVPEGVQMLAQWFIDKMQSMGYRYVLERCEDCGALVDDLVECGCGKKICWECYNKNDESCAACEKSAQQYLQDANGGNLKWMIR